MIKNFFKAGRDHDRLEHMQFVTGVAMAVTHGIDVSLNKGKAKVLDTYFKALEKEKLREGPKPKGTIVGKSAMAFFESLPKRGPKDAS
jgi:hypothetical protein